MWICQELEPMKIKALIVDDDRYIRDGMAQLLECEEDIEVVGKADSGELALTLAESTTPDIIIMDYSMPGMDGAETTKMIMASGSTPKIIGVSMHTNTFYVKRMKEAGAVAFLPKGSDLDELLLAIRRVLEGQTYFPEYLYDA